MSVFSLRPRVNDLVFQVYAKRLHPELFHILALRRIQRENYQAAVWITPTGHVITWETDHMVFSEVTAAADPPLADAHLLLDYRLRGEHSGRLAGGKGTTYQVSFQVETLPPEVFLHVHDEILNDARKRGFFHNFQPNHRLAIAPLAYVDLDAKPNYLLVSTFHTFPQEHTVIKSQSLFEKK